MMNIELNLQVLAVKIEHFTDTILTQNNLQIFMVSRFL